MSRWLPSVPWSSESPSASAAGPWRRGVRLAGLAMTLAAPLLLGTSCDTFKGSVLAITLAWPFRAPPTFMLPLELADNEHIEMWAKLGSGQVIRLPADVTAAQHAEARTDFTGFTLARAVNPDDPCLIRGLDADDRYCAETNVNTDGFPQDPTICGAHLFSRTAQIKTPAVPDDVTNTNDPRVELAQQALVQHGRQVTDVRTPFNAVAVKAGDPVLMGKAAVPMFALVQYNPDAANEPRKQTTLAKIDSATAEDPTESKKRLYACRDYRDGPGAQPAPKGHPFFYVGNPRQYTKPLAGVLFGFFSFTTSPSTPPKADDLPSQNFGGMTFSVPYAPDDPKSPVPSLDDIQQILITRERSTVPPAQYTPPTVPNVAEQLFLGVRQPESAGGRGVIRFVMIANVNPAISPPSFNPPTPVGTAALLTDLNQRLD